MKRRRISLMPCLLIVFLLVSCWGSKEIQLDELVGTYTFTYPSGEIEVLLIKKDSTYTKDIYTQVTDFENKSTPKYTNLGKWKLVHNNELNFYGWLAYNDAFDPFFILSKPEYVTMLNIYWIKRHEKSEIFIDEEAGYIFKKMD